MRKKQELDMLRQISTDTTKEIAASKEAFRNFLSFQAKLYKHRFEDALLIYNYRPNAVACATLNQWNKIGRRVHKGTTSMRVFADDHETEIKHLFELRETYGKAFTYPFRFNVPEQYQARVLESFETALPSDTFSKNFKWCIENYVNELYDNFIEDFILAKKQAEPNKYISLGIAHLTDEGFRQAVTECVGYMVCERFGIPKGIYDSDNCFKDLSKFNTKEMVVLLGATSQFISRSTIEHVNSIINEERTKENERYQNQQANDHSREIRPSDRADSGGSNGNRGAGSGGKSDSTASERIHQNVDEIHGGPSPGPQGLSEAGGPLAADHRGSGQGDSGNVLDASAAISGEIPETRGKHPGDIAVRGTAEVLVGGNPVPGDSTQITITDSEGKEPIQGSFFVPADQQVSDNHSLLEHALEYDHLPEDPPASITVETEPPANFRITNDNLHEGGAKTKFSYNIEAIRTLKELEAENRSATADEQEILSRYSGWGGIPQAFDPDNANWTKQYNDLKNLLTEQEYEFARGSTLNAHYTSSSVVEAMYSALDRLGFQSGNILEPSMGVGIFFGMMPESMMEQSRLYGVELDSVTGRIAKQLYPNANIQVAGFESANLQDNFFDAAVGNVPFGSYKLHDPKFNKHNLLIHDYFIAKSLDKIKPEGIIAYITTKGTMDKANASVRRYLTERAELLGAIRLPNNTFKQSAGTEVTTDILFLKKRDKLIDANEESWVYTGLHKTGRLNSQGEPETVPLNQYFIDNPHMMLGTMAYDKSMYGNEKETALLPFESGGDLKDLLNQAISFLPENVVSNTVTLEELEIADDASLPADPTVKNFCHTVIGGRIYQREDSLMKPVVLPKTTTERVKALIEIRDTAKNLLDIQLNGCTDEELKAVQEILNDQYDKFIQKYGVINSKYNAGIFGTDAEFPLISSLEEAKGDEQVIKADIFWKRTLMPVKKIEHADTAVEALTVSLNESGCIDIPYMSKLTGKKSEEVINDLTGIIFKNPLPDSLHKEYDLYANWETADEYLSGNVVQKLELAEKASLEDEIYLPNVRALENAQPVPLEAHEINVKIGSSWIEPKYYQQFIREHFKPGYWDKSSVSYADITNTWHIDKPYSRNSSIEATQVYGTKRMDSYTLMELMLNQRSPKIYDTVEDSAGNEKRVINKAETIAIKNKYTVLNETFRKWLWSDPERRETLTGKYNRLFNSERARQYDGSFFRFSGMNAGIQLKEHQQNAVARILFGGNTLLAHVVGAGKTFTMTAAAMEMKRLGIASKPCFVVPNHLVEQWANEFKRLYPGANVLAATKKDFAKAKRQRFCARIATGEWDAVIISHSSFEKIPLSPERQISKIKGDIRTVKNAIEEMKYEKDENFLVKEMERTVKSLEARLKKMNDAPRDNVINFENLGIDALFLDEAHAFKNKFMFTKMGNIAGLSKTSSKKSYDMEMKCDYINEVNNSERGVVFATGTPVANSMVELYTMQTYLQKQALQERGLHYFDNWSANFGEVVSSLELAPSGQGFRMKDRFAKFVNLPELMNMYRKIADIQTADMLNLPVPKVMTGKPVTIAVDPSPAQKELVNVLVELSQMVSEGRLSPEEYNMLCVTNDGRLGALDMRCVDVEKFSQLTDREHPELVKEDYEYGKVNACVRKVFEIYEDTAADNLTQMIFCDVSTPKNGKQFSVYDDVKEKLVKLGVDEKEIAFIHQANTDEEKEKLFGRMRRGELRILLGSTQRMGAGTNVQTKLIAEHHLDCPWRPADLEQREGRIVRQGNNNSEVQIYNYVTKQTFDSYLWQIVESKQKFISQVMTGQSPPRTMDDVDASILNYAEVKAIATGNSAIRRKMELEMEVSRLQVLEKQYYASKYNLEDRIAKHYPARIASASELAKNLEHDIRLREENDIGQFYMILGKNTFTERKDAGELLLKAVQSGKYADKEIGYYMGFAIIPQQLTELSAPKIVLKGAANHSVELSASERGSIQRIENAIAALEERLASERAALDKLNQQIEAAKTQVSQPFEQARELAAALEELNEVNDSLDIGKEDLNLVFEDAPVENVVVKGGPVVEREEIMEEWEMELEMV